MRLWNCLCCLVIALSCLLTTPLAAQNSGYSGYREFDNYFSPLTQKDKKNISFIINTLSEKSVFQLMLQKKALEQAGDRVSKVHPLRFLAYIFSNQNLKGRVKYIKGIPWKRFVNDMGSSLTEAANGGQMKQEYIQNFAETVGVDPSRIAPIIQSRKWKEFIDLVKNQVG